MDWQRRFREQPVVWCIVHDGGETGNLYESEEAAQVEIDWHHARQRGARVRIATIPIHSLALSRERWSPLPVTPAAP